MFTGIIEAIGTIESVGRRGGHRDGRGSDGTRIAIRCDSLIPSLSAGDSLAIDGSCLTIEERQGPVCTVFASQETLGKTTLGQKRRGDKVNLERPLGVSGRFGGHIVTGHVDVVGRIKSIRQNGETRTLAIAFPATMRHFIVSKGSISVDGISLTILNLHDNLFSICVIPHTWKNTTMQWKTPGDPVNLEFDILAKYLYAWAHGKMEGAAAELPLQKGTKLTRELLERTGFT